MNEREYNDRKAVLRRTLASTVEGTYTLCKRSPSNLFRYTTVPDSAAKANHEINLSAFNNFIKVDPFGKNLDVEGPATFESMVDATLPYGLVPKATPELKHIAVGGAIAGIGIESSSYRHGFVHDGMQSAEVLLGDG